MLLNIHYIQLFFVICILSFLLSMFTEWESAIIQFVSGESIQIASITNSKQWFIRESESLVV